MTEVRTLPQSFVAGELSERMAGRPDDPKYQHGARRLENMLVEPSGCARRRGGTDLVRQARSNLTKHKQLPFGLPDGNTLFLELGFRDEYPGSSTVPAYARFHTQGGTELHSVPWSITATYAVGDYVRDGGKLYRCTVAHAPSHQPPNISFWFPLEYVANKSCDFSAVSLVNDDITFASAHTFETGDPIEWTSDTGGAPIQYTDGVSIPDPSFFTGFAIKVSSTVIKLSLTAGGAALNLTAKGTGTHRFHRSYTRGELVSFGGDRYHFCRTTRPIGGSPQLSIVPLTDEVYWYEMPVDLFEIPIGWVITEAQLMATTNSQSGTTIKFANNGTAPSEIVRTGAHTAFWRPTGLTPNAAPTGATAVATKKGLTLTIFALAGVGGGGARTQVSVTADKTFLAEGIDYVWIEGSVQANLNGKTFSVENGATPKDFVVRDIETGDYVTYGGNPAGGGTARPTRPNSDVSNEYQVTWVDADGRESLPSSTATVTSNLFVPGAYNTVSWNAVAGAVKYNVYRKRIGTGTFGKIGESTGGATFKDDGTTVHDMGTNPPIQDTTFGAVAGQYPRAVVHYEGRCGYAGTDELSQDMWLSRTNSDSDFTYGIPIQATHRIHQKLKTKVGCTIRHLVPIGKLLALSDRAEFRIGSIDTEALTNDSFAARSDTFIGCSTMAPEVMHNAAIFAGNRGGHLYMMGWNDAANGYAAVDLCERATHLFDGFTPRQQSSTLAPFPIDWVCMEDGRLLGLTIVPGQQVFAWHRHTTDGIVETVACGSDGGEDRIYLGIKRTLPDGTVKRFVERMTTLQPTTYANSQFSDCALTYTGAPITVVTGLSHLEGKTVTVFADGKLQTRKKIVGGQITLDKAASTVRVGLPVVVKGQSMPAAFAAEAYGSGRPKSLSKVWTRVEASGNFKLGPSEDSLLDADKILADTPFSGLLETRVSNSWAFDGSIFWQQDDPLPLTLICMHAELAVGG